jgi:hypothetical protein
MISSSIASTNPSNNPTPNSSPRDIPTFPARPVNGGRLELRLASPLGEWFVQPKYNGWRALVHAPSGLMFNRQGEPLTIAAEFSAALDQLKAMRLEWIDCEALERRHNIGRGSLIVLDYIPLGADANKTTFTDRRYLLELAAAFAKIEIHRDYNLPIEPNRAYLAASLRVDQVPPTHPVIEFLARGGHIDPDQPITSDLALYHLLKASNRHLSCDFWEGVVCKEKHSIYPIQRRNPSEEFPFWVKHRWQF